MLGLKWFGIGFMLWFLLSMLLTVMGIEPIGTVNAVVFFTSVGLAIVGYRGDKAKRQERAAATAKAEDATQRSVTF